MSMNGIIKISLLAFGLLAALFAAEFFLRQEQNYVADRVDFIFQPEWLYDKNIGRLHAPNSHTTHTLKVNDQIIYSVTYNIDPLGRRTMPVNPNNPKRFVALFGSSAVFGQGLEDTETWPYQLSTLMPEFQVYNYGIHGDGPQSLVGISQRIIKNKEVKESHGFFIYYFTFHHLKRLLGTISVTDWTNSHLYLSLNSKGEIINNGPFETARPIRYKIFEFLRVHGKLIRRLQLDFPPINEDTYELLGKILLTIKANFQTAYPNSKFLVMLNDKELDQTGDVIKMLKKNDISYFIMERPQRSKAYRHHEKYDDHENPAGARLLAERVQLFLEENFTND